MTDEEKLRAIQEYIDSADAAFRAGEFTTVRSDQEIRDHMERMIAPQLAEALRRRA